MDFNAIWPLLRKEGWDAKHGTGMQIHHNYVKPGRRVRGGRQGVGFFNGEDELLAYVRTDVELCNRLKMSNDMVRPQYQSNQRRTRPRRPTAPAAMASPSPPPESVKSAKKRPVAATLTTKSKKPTKPKKRTKKQTAEDADKRRKELAAFGNRLHASFAQ
ncbi:hypothetical protein PI124_g8245 [Phytophthora idaei]|nr:hypothetical protein PI125_g16192 [Phytophthora idaei]KAG3148873.1 hypothetical protein PI126_g12276 [Phytophthora idaei]KAG3247039.1 hypothetical protein PI124_g8245 [Phytophthora idaei]